MSDNVVSLANGSLARLLVERRCEKCGTWLVGGDLGHGSFSAIAAGQRICNGKGAGRFRRRVFVTSPTEKQRQQVADYYQGHPEFHPLLRWRKATTEERAEAISVQEHFGCLDL
jgi:hypothetical protein